MVLSVGRLVNAMSGTAEIRLFSTVVSAIGCICVVFIVTFAEIIKK